MQRRGTLWQYPASHFIGNHRIMWLSTSQVPSKSRLHCVPRRPVSKLTGFSLREHFATLAIPPDGEPRTATSTKQHYPSHTSARVRRMESKIAGKHRKKGKQGGRMNSPIKPRIPRHIAVEIWLIHIKQRKQYVRQLHV